MRGFEGWKPNPSGVEEILSDAHTHEVRQGADDIKNYSDEEYVVLLDAVIDHNPRWLRRAQGIGDCVSWGYELCAYISMCVDVFTKRSPYLVEGEVATEPIYGGSRVEARGRSRGGYSDGSYGAAAAKWLTKWGVLFRKDYSADTGYPEHDLTKYSAKKAKDWGNYGCGGDEGHKALDEIARSKPVKEAVLCESYDQLVAAIENGYPVSICSNQGLSQRDNDGFANPSGSWAHCMAATGRRLGKREGVLITNSWGNSWGTKKPLPGVSSENIKKCSAWVDAKVVDRMLKQWRDSFIITGVDGLVKREIDWDNIWRNNGR